MSLGGQGGSIEQSPIVERAILTPYHTKVSRSEFKLAVVTSDKYLLLTFFAAMVLPCQQGE